MEMGQQELVDLGWSWEQIAPVLKEVPGADVTKLKRYFEEGPAKQGIHFFVVQYRPGTVIMAKGSTSDYAAIHLQGVVRVRHAEVKQHVSGPGCWHSPRLRRLQNLVLAASEADSARRAGMFDRLLSILFLRFPGIVLWLIDTNRYRMQPWGGEARAQRLEKLVSRVLRGKLGFVRRSERQLGRPVSAVDNAASENGTAPGKDAPEPAEFANEKRLTIRDENGQLLPVDRRFMGLSGALWSRPRSVTLIAEDDPAANNAPCQMLLIKRKALHELFKSPQGEKFLKEQLRKFVGLTLPELLANNRFFHEMLYVEDVHDWDRLLTFLRGQQSDSSAADALRQKLRSLLDDDFKSWLELAPLTAPNDAERVRAVAALNKVLADRLLLPSQPSLELFQEAARDEALKLLDRRDALTGSETCRLNRLLLESALAPALKFTPRPWPLFPEEFQKFAIDLLDVHERLGLPTPQPEPYEKDKVIFQKGDPADALYLVLSGMVRVFRSLPGGETAANNLEGGTSFGEAAFIDEVVPAANNNDPPTMVPAARAAGVRTLCKSYLLRFDRLAFKELQKSPEYAWLSAKFQSERRRVLSRDELFQSGWIIIPRDPPPKIAERLVLTRNLLLIDMERCTRCDQCVQGCAAAHDGQPRFHRSNPELRFGHWEVARACMNCLDAPCMEACPVGAITLLDGNAVQIHRTRCIGCSKCAKECPFGVIDMYDPLSKEDAPSSKKQVANKCDLCLTEDYDPPCVTWCPYDAAQRVDPNEFFSGLKGRADFSDRQQSSEPQSKAVATAK
jgi:Fe-S-cluster-containing hydrogenase component 2/CRP-like cAMP-binding protein